MLLAPTDCQRRSLPIFAKMTSQLAALGELPAMPGDAEHVAVGLSRIRALGWHWVSRAVGFTVPFTLQNSDFGFQWTFVFVRFKPIGLTSDF